MTTLDLEAARSLLTKLEAADHGSRTLDAEIHRTLIGPTALDQLAGAHSTTLDGVVALIKRHPTPINYRIDSVEGCAVWDSDHDEGEASAGTALGLCTAYLRYLVLTEGKGFAAVENAP